MELFSRIDHVSLAVREFERASDFFERVFRVIPGASGSPGEIWDFRWQVFSFGDLTRLELISQNGAGGFLKEFLSKREGGVHHITIETPDIKKVQDHLDRNNVPYFGYSEELDNWKELFIHPRHAFGVLIQIAEFRADDWLSESVKFPEKGPRWSVESNGDEVNLAIAHPGGGKAQISLSKKEAKGLIRELEGAI